MFNLPVLAINTSFAKKIKQFQFIFLATCECKLCSVYQTQEKADKQNDRQDDRLKNT